MVIGNPDIPTYGLCLCYIFFDIPDVIISAAIQEADAGGKSPYESGYDHGCDDADEDFNDRYVNQPERGPRLHTEAFVRDTMPDLMTSPVGTMEMTVTRAQVVVAVIVVVEEVEA